MRNVEILYVPGGRLRRIAADGLPEERQFESEAPPVRGLQIPGVVPPLGLKVRMIEMIARKFVTVSRQGRAVLRRERLQKEQRRNDARKPTLHGQPRPDSAAPQFAQGRDRQARSPHTQL